MRKKFGAKLYPQPVMNFDGTADEEHIRQISVDSALPMDERIRMMKESIRHCD